MERIRTLINRLTEMGLVRPQGTVLQAISPMLAEATALGAEDLELAARRAMLEARRNTIRRLVPEWNAALEPIVRDTAVDVITDPGLLALVEAVGISFHVGELMVAIALLRARTVAAWVPTLMIVHAVTTPLMLTFPHEWRGLHTALLGAALMGLAMRASEAWADSNP